MEDKSATTRKMYFSREHFNQLVIEENDKVIVTLSKKELEMIDRLRRFEANETKNLVRNKKIS